MQENKSECSLTLTLGSKDWPKRECICAQNLCTDSPFLTFFVLKARFPDLPAQIFIFHTFSCLTCHIKNGSWEHRLTQKILVLVTRTFFMRSFLVLKYPVPSYNYFQMKFKLCSAKVLHHITV